MSIPWLHRPYTGLSIAPSHMHLLGVLQMWCHPNHKHDQDPVKISCLMVLSFKERLFRTQHTCCAQFQNAHCMVHRTHPHTALLVQSVRSFARLNTPFSDILLCKSPLSSTVNISLICAVLCPVQMLPSPSHHALHEYTIVCDVAMRCATAVRAAKHPLRLRTKPLLSAITTVRTCGNS